jgi:hypothetical protein
VNLYCEEAQFTGLISLPAMTNIKYQMTNGNGLVARITVKIYTFDWFNRKAL